MHRFGKTRHLGILVALAIIACASGAERAAAQAADGQQPLPASQQSLTAIGDAQMNGSASCDGDSLSTESNNTEPVTSSDQQTSGSADSASSSANQDQTTTPAADASVPTEHPGDHFVHDLVGDLFHDESHIWTGFLHPSTYNSHAMMKYGIPFILISGALIATDRDTVRWLPSTPSFMKGSGIVSQFGAPYTLAGASAVTYLIGHVTDNEHVQETGFLSLEAIAESQFMVLIIKEVTQRSRPIQGAQRGGFWEGGGSFPSGHAAGAFAMAAVISYEYPDHIAVPIVAYTLASLVGVSRLGAREHWYSDVFVGATVGFLSGRYVYKQHHDPILPGSFVSHLRPSLGFREQGLGLYWDF